MKLPLKRGILDDRYNVSICMSDLLESSEIVEETHSLLVSHNQNNCANCSEQMNEEIFSTLSPACSLPLLNDGDYDVKPGECIKNRRYRDLFKSTFKLPTYKHFLTTVKNSRDGESDSETLDFQQSNTDYFQINSNELVRMPRQSAWKMRRSRSQTLNSNNGIVCSNEDLRFILARAQNIKQTDTFRNRRRTHSLDSNETVRTEISGTFKHSVSATLYEESVSSLENHIITTNEDYIKSNFQTLNESDEIPPTPNNNDSSFNVAWGENEVVDAGIFGEVIERHLENLKTKTEFKSKTCVSDCKSRRLMAQLCGKEIKNFECQSSFCSRLISRFKKMNLVYI